MSQVYSDFAGQSQWPSHLLPHQQPPFPSPPANDYPHTYFPAQDTRHGLSLNIDGLSVQSPPNLSPINPPQAAVLSPQTPISPSTGPFAGQHIHQSPFQFDPHQGSPGQQSPHYDEHNNLAPPGSAAGSTYDRRAVSRSGSLPRKRSFPSSAPSTETVDEVPLDEARETAMDMGYDDFTPYGASTNGGGSPVDGSGNTSGAEDTLNGPGSGQMSLGVGGSMNVLGKPMATNNFVTKLYQ